jgi:hypothetical protein
MNYAFLDYPRAATEEGLFNLIYQLFAYDVQRAIINA